MTEAATLSMRPAVAPSHNTTVTQPNRRSQRSSRPQRIAAAQASPSFTKPLLSSPPWSGRASPTSSSSGGHHRVHPKRVSPEHPPRSPKHATTNRYPSQQLLRTPSVKPSIGNGETSASSYYSTQSSTYPSTSGSSSSATEDSSLGRVGVPVTPERSNSTNHPVVVTPRSTAPAATTPNHHHHTDSPGAVALEYSAQAGDCLAQEDFTAALGWYQRALLVYQNAVADSAPGPSTEELSIVDTCNAAATLHNMGAVYTALPHQADEALQCYSDAEQLYRECRERLHDSINGDDSVVHNMTHQEFVAHDDQDDNPAMERICLTALIAETLHHRSHIYESSVWDSVAALECHEACVELLMEEETHNNNNETQKEPDSVPVVCLDDVYFQLACRPAERLGWLTKSYRALAQLYKHSDTPHDGLVVLQAWHDLLEKHLAQSSLSKSSSGQDTADPTNTAMNPWRQSLADCCRQMSDYYFTQDEMARGIDALYQAMELTLQIQQQQNGSGSVTSISNNNNNSSSTTTPEKNPPTDSSSSPSSSLQQTAAVLSHELLQQMNALASTQEHRGDYDQALVCYEKVLLLVSRYLGENHIEVAETLVNMGRIMERQGNAAGGLDLYHAAHSIYQAAIKDGSDGSSKSTSFFGEGDVVDTSTSTTTSNTTNHPEDLDRALSIRAATESVVRIANVLMDQKRWEEAVDFLRELPQAKEWLSWLDDTASDSEASTTARKSPTASPPRESTPSVDQAIVFRELGRAYMGMGSMAKAKQCLLESARRLEGTDHEEDVFELLMHVEFCQKQEQKAAEMTSRNRHISSVRSRSRSRARSRTRTNPAGSNRKNRSGHSRANSIGSSSQGEKTRITKDAVAAVLAPPLGKQGPASAPLTPPRLSGPTDAERKEASTEALTVESSNEGQESQAVVFTNDSNLQGTPKSPQMSRTSADQQALQESRSSDSRSLGSLASSNLQTPIKGGKGRFMMDDALSPSDSFQVQRAKDIVLKRSCSGSSPSQDYDDNKSDVVSSILVGLDIDIDLPPASPTPPPGRPLSLYSMLTTPKSGSEKPFDEASTSQASSRGDRPFDESSRQSGSYPKLPGYRPQTSLSDLTPTVGQSASSSMNDSTVPFKPVKLPPLLQNESETDVDPSMLPPPPSSDGHRVVKDAHALSKVGVGDKSNVNQLAQRSSTLPALSSTYPVQQRRVLEQHAYQPSCEEDDDASSDPFEGYEEFDADDISEGERSPSYSGDSESEQGYTRFAKEDFTSDEEDSVASGYSYGREAKYPLGLAPSHSSGYLHHASQPNLLIMSNHDEHVYEDDRQPLQVEDMQEMFAVGTRESPNSSGNTTEGVPVASRTLPNRDNSPTFNVGEKVGKPEKETRPASPSPQKVRRQTPSPSPSHRIVRALSNTIRRRGKKKQDRGFETLPSNDSKDNSAPNVKAVEDAAAAAAAAAIAATENEDVFDEDLIGAPGRPIQFLSMPSPSFDDAVSQITFLQDDYHGKGSKKGNQWWGQLGLTTEKLDGWFPNTYLHQAVEAAEGFLSAKAIHAQVKSQPLDFDDEEDDDDLIRRSNSALPEASKTDAGAPPAAVSRSVDVGVANDGELQLVKSDSHLPGSVVTPAIAMEADQPLEAPDLHKNSALLKEAVLALDVLSATPSPRKGKNDAKGTLVHEVERHEKLVEQLEADGMDDDETNQQVAATLFRLSILYIQSNKVDDAMDATNEALRVQKSLGDTEGAARSLHLLADIFVRKGEYDSALSCYTEVQEMELELYGYIHEDTANTLNRIGGVLARQSKFCLAMEKHQEALRILKECHGEELRHPLVSQTLIHIGAVYYRERNSLTTVRKGSDGYTTFIEVGMLEVIGRAHEDRGSYKMAISFFEETLQFLNQKNKDPSTVQGRANLENVATTLNSLGMLSCRAGIFMEAIDYYDRALEVQKQIGCDKVHIATARVLTATVQFHLGYFRKALRLLQDALEELQIETGADHETVAATWFQIGVVQVALCEYDDGMDALEEALRIQNKLLGKNHPATLRTRREIGNMYAIYESELDAAFLLFNDILSIQRRIHGIKHPNVAETLHSLGCAYSRKGDFANAIKALEECYYMRMDFVGADHPLQATTLHEIAEIHRRRNRHRKAIHICNSVLEIRKESLSDQHLDVARTLATKADSLVATGKFDQASAALTEALPMAEAAVGSKHPAVADIYVHLAGMHLRKCHFEEAKEWIEKAREIYQNSNLDDDHPSLKEANALMERVDRDEMLCV